MLKKMLLAGVLALTVSAAVVADDFVAMTLNFYAEGNIVPDVEFPAGIVMMPRVRFPKKSKLPGHAYCVDFNLEKARELDATFTVKGEGKLVVSVNPRTMEDGKRVGAPRIKCVKMIVNGKPAKTPFVFDKWRYAAAPIMVKNGDTISIEAAFEKVE